MLIKMNKQVFDSTEDIALGIACFEPVIPKIRGKNISVKEEVYNQLSTGQQALFMFNAYYNHAANSLSEFYWWNAYYYAQPKSWLAINQALKYFRADDMLKLLEKMEQYFQARNLSRSLEKFEVSYKDLEKDSELLSSIRHLNTKFIEISPATLQIIGEFIRNHSNLFIQLEE